MKSDFASISEQKMPFYPEYSKKSGTCYIELNINKIKEYLENKLDKKYGLPLISGLRPYSDPPEVVSDNKKFHNYVCELEEELSGLLHLVYDDFWEWLDDNYKDMKSWKTVEKEFIDKESIEYEVEFGEMIDEDTVGTSRTTCFKWSEKELAIEEFDRLKNSAEYDFVILYERTMDGKGCLFTDRLMDWYSPRAADWDCM